MDEYYRYLYLKKKLESDASFLSSMVADSKSTPKRNPSSLSGAQSGYRGSDSTSVAKSNVAPSLQEMQEVDSLLENQNSLRKNIMLSKSKLSGLLNSGFKISADLEGKKGEDLTALFNPIYFLDKHEEPSQYASRVWRSDLKEAQQQLHAMELDLQDVEKVFEKVELLSFNEHRKIRSTHQIEDQSEIILSAHPSGSAIGGTCWKIEYNK
jgi:hypothetical protein